MNNVHFLTLENKPDVSWAKKGDKHTGERRGGGRPPTLAHENTGCVIQLALQIKHIGHTLKIDLLSL